jgi:hypothetical protein
MIKYSLLLALTFLISSCKVQQSVNSSTYKKEDNRCSTNGLLAYYSFDSNARDMSGNNNDGEVMGATLTNDRNAKENSAYYFDGINDYIYIKDAENLRLKGEITMSIWFKTDYSLPFAGIICKADPVEPRRGYLIDIDDNNRIRTDICFDHSKGKCGTIVSDDKLTDNKWHHVIASYNGRKYYLFIDGRIEKKIKYKIGLQTNTEPLLIGWDMNTWLSHRHFKGSIDDIRIYNRFLSRKDMLNLYREQ